MAETKTTPTGVAVEEFLTRLDDPRKREGSHTLIALMRKITGSPPKMWGPSIIGFGTYHYKYATGHEGDTCLAGFSPRKAEYSIYLWWGDSEERAHMLEKLGKHRVGKSCLYVKRLEDIDIKVLEQLVRWSIAKAQSSETVATA